MGRRDQGGHDLPSETFEGGAKTIQWNLKNFAMTRPLNGKFKGMGQREATALAPLLIEKCLGKGFSVIGTQSFRTHSASLLPIFLSVMSLKVASFQPWAKSCPRTYLSIFVESVEC